MRIAIFAAALAASTALAAPAFAQDKDPAGSAFTGPRVEAVVGWDHVKDGTGPNTSADGVTYGGIVGYDFQAGRLTFGVEGEVDGATTRDTINNLRVAGDSLSVRAGRDLYAGARLGIAVTPKALLYVKGGYTNAAANSTYTSGASTLLDHQNLDGWRIGAGAELKLTHNIYAKAEYRYSQYDTLRSTGADATRNQLLGGLGVRF